MSRSLVTMHSTTSTEGVIAAVPPPMFLPQALCSRRQFHRWAAALGLTGLLSAGRSSAAAIPVVTSIEEDWYIKIGEPKAADSAPQVTLVTTPLSNLSGGYAVLEMNHIPLPDFQGGGMQLQTWLGDYPQSYKQHNSFNALSTSGEEITLTFSTTVHAGGLRFQVSNGTSQTWGQFGRDNSFKLDLPCSITSLNTYSASVVTRYSRVSYAGHCVSSLTLREVRYFSAGTLVYRDTTSRNVHSYNS